MNLKKITALLTTLPVFMSVSSAATLSDTKATIASDYKSVVISGSVADFGDDILVKVLNPGYKDSDIETALGNLENPILAVDTITAEDINGTVFTKTIGLKNGIVSEDAIERFYIYLSGDGISASAPLEMWYVEDIQSEVDAVKAQTSSDALRTYLFTNAKIYVNDPETLTYDTADLISIKNSMYVENSSDASIAKFIFADKAQLTDIVSLKQMFKLSTLAANLETQNVAALIKSDNQLKETIYTATDAMSPMEAVFTSEMTANGRQTVLDNLKGRSWINLQAFNKDFASQLVYAATAMNVSNGHGHIPALVQKYHNLPQELKEYDYSEFLSLGADQQLSAANTLMQQGVSSPADMHQKIATIVYNIKNPPSDNGSTGSTGGGGGGGNPSNINVGYLQNLQNESNKKEDEWLAGFSDMENHSWAKEAVSYLSAKSVVSGTSNTTFSPQNKIKREEFAKMLVLAMSYAPSNEKQPFSDVQAGSWYEQYVATLKEKGITTGSGDNKFNVGANITRQDACTLIYRAAADKLADGEATEFADSGEISEYAKEAVLSLSASGIILGNDEGEFNPTDNLTRAEAAVVFYRLMTQGGSAK